MGKIHPTAIIDSKAEIGKDVVVGPHCCIEAGAEIGDGCSLDVNVIIAKNIKIGKKNIFYPNCVIGKNPQTLGATPESKFGKLEIGDENLIREFATIHPSIYPDGITKIGNNNLIMVGVHIGHDVVLEDKIVISNNAQISGHCKIETGVWLSYCLIQQFVTMGQWSYATAYAGINHDVTPFMIVSGHYPPRIRIVNTRGLKRAGLNEQEQKAIEEAYKFLFRRKAPLLESAKELAARRDIDKNVRAMTDSIINSSKHRFGRYLETLRRKH